MASVVTQWRSMRTILVLLMLLCTLFGTRIARAQDASVEAAPPAETIAPAQSAPAVEPVPPHDDAEGSQVPSGLAEAQWGALPDDAAEPKPSTDVSDAQGSNDEFRIGGRLIAGFQVRDRRPEGGQDEGLQGTDYGFVLQQARIRAELRPNKRLRIVVSAEFSDALDPTAFDPPPYLRNAYLQFTVEKRWLELRVGRFKRPYSRIELRSSGDLPMRGRGLGNALIVENAEWGDRAVGVMLQGRVAPARLRWWLSASNPEWRVGADPQGLDLLARVTWEATDAIEFGLGGGHKSTEDAMGGGVAVMAGGVDARVRFEGFELLTDLLVGQQAQVAGQPLSLGAAAVASYEVPVSKDVRLQPTLFGEWADADIEYSGDDALRIVFGTNLLWKKSFRVMPQFELVRPLGTVTALNRWPATDRFMLVFSGQM